MMVTTRVCRWVMVVAILASILAGCNSTGDAREVTPTATVTPIARATSSSTPSRPDNTSQTATPVVPRDQGQAQTATPTSATGDVLEPTPTSPPLMTGGSRGSGGSTFVRAYGAEDQLYGTAIVPSENGGVYVAAYRDDVVAPFVLVRMGSSGETLWERSFFSEERYVTTPGYLQDTGWSSPIASYAWVAMSPGRAGGVLLASGDRAVRVGPTGEVLWSRRYIGWLPDQHLVITSIVEHPTQGFYLLAASAIGQSPHGSRIGADDDDLLLVRITNGGEVEWTRRYSSFLADRRSDLRLAGEGDLILGARAAGPGGGVMGLVARLDLEGAVIWARTLDTGLTGDEAYDRAGLGNITGFQSLGIRGAVGSPDYQVLVCLGQNLRAITHPGGEAVLVAWLSPDGNLTRAALAHSSVADGFNQALAVEPTAYAMGGVLLAGKTTEFARPRGIMNRNILVMSLSGEGQWQWVRSIGRIKRSVSSNEHSDETATDLYAAPDGSLWLVGTSDSFSLEVPWYERPQPKHFDLLVARLNAFGGASEGTDLVHGEDFAPPQVRVNPMPGGGEVFRPNATERVTVTSVDGGYSEVDLGPELSQRDLSMNTGSEDDLLPTLSVVDDVPRLVTSGRFYGIRDTDLDLDEDYIPQAWENAAMELVNPIIVTDEEEKWLGARDAYPIVNFVNVAPYPDRDDPTHILFYYCTAWSKDYGADVANLEEHRGDTERVVMAWRILDRNTLELEWVFTSAHKAPTLHEGVWSARHLTCNRGTAANVAREEVASQMMCAELEFTEQGVLVLYAAENKHALYPTAQICENATLVMLEGVDVTAAMLPPGSGGSAPEDISVYREDCGWDAGNDASGGSSGWEWRRTDLEADHRYLGRGRWRFDCVNAGNEEVHLVDDLDQWQTWRGLTSEQFLTLTVDEPLPNEAIWSGHHDGGSYCGGLETNCRWELSPVALAMVRVCDHPSGCSQMVGTKITEIPVILRQRLTARYRVTVETSDLAGAGTDADVTIRILDAAGAEVLVQAQSAPQPVASDPFQGASLEAGDTDVLYDLVGAGEQTALDDVDRIQIMHNDADGAAWRVRRITVEDLVENTRIVFTIDAWLPNGMGTPVIYHYPDAG